MEEQINKVTLTTTLDRLRSAGACKSRYAHLLRALGGPSFDHDASINLLTILEHNGTEDCLWALCATVENCDQVERLMAADFAEAVLPLFESQYPNDSRPRAAIEAARKFATGEITAAARAAAGDAAWDAAGAAAWEAARAAAREAQAVIIRRYLDLDSPHLRLSLPRIVDGTIPGNRRIIGSWKNKSTK